MFKLSLVACIKEQNKPQQEPGFKFKPHAFNILYYIFPTQRHRFQKRAFFMLFRKFLIIRPIDIKDS